MARPPTRAWTSTSAAAGCSSSAPSCSRATATTSCRWPAIAREAGISKALLYHYFPSKQAYFSAVLAQKAPPSSRALIAPDAALRRPSSSRSLDAFLGWVEESGDAYAKLVRGAARPEVREVIGAHPRRTPPSGSSPASAATPTPAAAHRRAGWLWFMDGAILDWLEHRDLDRAELRDLLLRALEGALGEPL